jgi:glutamyl-tRNA synthetase
MTVRTRIAPSPTGYLHLGTARTALFNWLFAKHHNGQFLIRIEDTDQARSTQEAVDIIFESLSWLGLESTETTIFQSDKLQRHIVIANELYKRGNAYYCACSPELLEQKKEEARRIGLSPKYDGTCRTKNLTQGVLRFKMPQQETSTFDDLVQGTITVENSLFEDFVLLRSNGMPTYMLAVVVDDHDMDITHVIRGDDHLINTFKQIKLYQALEWPLPKFAHIPLIHGQDGTKFSKRHGAPAVTDYKNMGILPEALFNYLLRLGWSHGNQEIFNREEAIRYFDLAALNKSAARFDPKKLLSLNSHYLKEKKIETLLTEMSEFLRKNLNRPLKLSEEKRLLIGLPGLVKRAETLKDLADSATIYCNIKIKPDPESQAILTPDAKEILTHFYQRLTTLTPWNYETLDTMIKEFLRDQSIKMPLLGKPLRVALTGRLNAPGLIELLLALGKELTLKRLSGCLAS